MKIGLFIGLLVLLASTNVFGDRHSERKSHTSSTVTGENASSEHHSSSSSFASSEKVVTSGHVHGGSSHESSKTVSVTHEETKSPTNERTETKNVKTVIEETKPVVVEHTETKNVKVVTKEIVPVEVTRKETKNVTVLREETVPVTVEHKEIKNVTVLREKTVPITVTKQEIRPVTTIREETKQFKTEAGDRSDTTVHEQVNTGISSGSVTTSHDQVNNGISSGSVTTSHDQVNTGISSGSVTTSHEQVNIGTSGESNTINHEEMNKVKTMTSGGSETTVHEHVTTETGGGSSTMNREKIKQVKTETGDGSSTINREEIKQVKTETGDGSNTMNREEIKQVKTETSGRLDTTVHENANKETSAESKTVVHKEITKVKTETSGGSDTTVHKESNEVHTLIDHGSAGNSGKLTQTSENIGVSKIDISTVDNRISTKPIDSIRILDNRVHVSGRIVLVKHRSSVVDSVQYDLDGARLLNGGQPILEPRFPFAREFLARDSRITLYVATSKTTDPKLAFAQFPIEYMEKNFPISFNIDVDLPNQQRGLLERADITLYFFVYIHNIDTRIDTFVPAGTSQILLQGTNRLVQKLDVYVRATGIEINGLFRGRFSQRFIRPGTSFQVLIVSEQSLSLLHTSTFESVAQITINTVPAMYPIPFSLLVHYQMLRPNTKYFAIAYIYENGIRHMINQKPIYVIDEQTVLVTPQVIFSVVPSPFILRGVVTRSMPGSFFLQPRSSLILRIHEIGSDSRDIIFKLPELITLPQVFQINMTQAMQFDASKNYDIRALITDEKNKIYMASLQPIPLLDEFSRLIVPVDDLLYYVNARLHASSNQFLSYIPGSTAQIFVTESPEAPTKPIVAARIDSISTDFRDFSIEVPATAIQRGRNYYLVMMIENFGIITHVSKTLLISNNQPPPLLIQLPVLSLNLVSGVIFDVEKRPAQWSSSSYASLYLLDDRAETADRGVVQVWKIHLENDFPVRFEVQIDFSRLRPHRIYRLQGAIENARSMLEYKPAGSVLTLYPSGGIITDVRIPVRNVKTYQRVSGLVYINDVSGPLPEHSEIVVQLSSSPSLTFPSIIEEIRIKVDGRTLPVDFNMKLSLNKIDINSVYYFFVRYIVRDTVVIPSSQAFAFSPRNEATVVLTLSKTPQIPITGQVTSTGSPLLLPRDSTLHLYITDNFNPKTPMIYSEVFLKASSNSLYEFTMNIDSVILQKKIPLYLRADILYEDTIILSIPRPALLQITPGGEWNINLVVDLPTLLIGQITSMSRHEVINGEFDVVIEILARETTAVVHTSRLRLSANLPQKFRIEIDNELFLRYPALQARALIKSCKEQILFETGGSVNIHTGINVHVDLPVILTDRKKLTEIQTTINDIASIYSGVWRLSVTGVVTDFKSGGLTSNKIDVIHETKVGKVTDFKSGEFTRNKIDVIRDTKVGEVTDSKFDKPMDVKIISTDDDRLRPRIE